MPSFEVKKTKGVLFSILHASLVFLVLSSLAATSSLQGEQKFHVVLQCGNDSSQNVQSCPNLSDAQISFYKENGKVNSMLTINPLATSNIKYKKDPYNLSPPLMRNTDLIWIEDFSLDYNLRNKLKVGFGTYNGASNLLQMDGLFLSGFLQDSGFKQIAAFIAINLDHWLPKGQLTLVGGNGEGQFRFKKNPQGYFGLELKSKGPQWLDLHLGFSEDGNNWGTASYLYAYEKYQDQDKELIPSSEKKGFSAKRLGVSAALNGEYPYAYGLKVGVGYQYTVYNQIDARQHALPSLQDLGQLKILDIDYFWAEDPMLEKAFSTIHNLYSISASYQIIATYDLAFSYSHRSVFSELPFFATCTSFDGEDCKGTSELAQQLAQSEISFGLITHYSQEILIALEYNRRSFDQLYNKFHYLKNGLEATSSKEALNLAISYAWE